MKQPNKQVVIKEFVEKELHKSISSDITMDLEEITNKSKKLDDISSLRSLKALASLFKVK
jgi:hypothetical protein